MSLLDDVKPEDAEDIVFKATEKVKFKVLDATENLDKGYLKLELEILSGDFEGREHSYMLFKKNKKEFAKFVLAVFTEEQLETGKASVGDLVAQELTAVATKPTDYQGKVYQNLVQWAKAED